VNFYIGNNPDSDGVTAIVPGTRGTWWGGYEDAISIARYKEGRELKSSEVSNYWLREGLSFLREDPGAFTKLFARKVWLFFNGREFSNNKDIYFFSRYSSLIRHLLFKHLVYFPFGIVSSLSIVGLALFAVRWRRLFLLYAFILSYTFSVVLFFVTSRYRMPVVAILLLFASGAVWQTVVYLRKGRFKIGLLSIGAFFLLALLTNSDLFGTGIAPDVQNYYTLGTVYSRKGEFNEAVDCYRRAIELDSTFADPHNNLGNIYARRGDMTAARSEFLRALALDPYFSKANFNLGNTYYSEGDFESAARLYEKAVGCDSLYAEAAYFAGLAYSRLQREDDARRMMSYAERLSRNIGRNRDLLEGQR
jgi:tetratricopeptide (TPR) repeat protein